MRTVCIIIAVLLGIVGFLIPFHDAKLILFLCAIPFIILFFILEKKEDGNHPIYFDYESDPGFWAHNDSLFMLSIYRKDSVGLTEELNTEEGWEIISSLESEPTGACAEEETTTETRKNGLKFEYNFFWKSKFEWLLQYDIVRMLYDKDFFMHYLSLAEQGDADAQTLVGCCYGHSKLKAQDVVVYNQEEALKWWHQAAEQNHKYAMREIALYHWHRGEKEEAKSWNEKGNLNIFVLNRYSKYSQQFPDKNNQMKEEN